MALKALAEITLVNVTTSLDALYYPYCLRRHEHGAYTVQDRGLHPIAYFWREHQYARVYIEGLTPAVAKKLSYMKRGDVEEIYLCEGMYIFHTQPKAVQAYMKRLAFLATLQVRPDYTSRVTW